MKSKRPLNKRGRMSNLKIDDWLLTESFRRAEERLGRRPDDKAAAIARASGRDFAGRLAARAAALPEAAAVRADIQRLVSGLGWLTLGLAVLGLLTGLVAGRAVAADRQVEIQIGRASCRETEKNTEDADGEKADINDKSMKNDSGRML